MPSVSHAIQFCFMIWLFAVCHGVVLHLATLAMQQDHTTVGKGTFHDT
jgi:hypothetical protein